MHALGSDGKRDQPLKARFHVTTVKQMLAQANNESCVFGALRASKAKQAPKSLIIRVDPSLPQELLGAIRGAAMREQLPGITPVRHGA